MTEFRMRGQWHDHGVPSRTSKKYRVQQRSKEFIIGIGGEQSPIKVVPKSAKQFRSLTIVPVSSLSTSPVVVATASYTLVSKLLESLIMQNSWSISLVY